MKLNENENAVLAHVESYYERFQEPVPILTLAHNTTSDDGEVLQAGEVATAVESLAKRGLVAAVNNGNGVVPKEKRE